MKKFLLLTVLLLVEFNIYAQVRVVKDENGEVITEFNYLTERVARYRGSIFLRDSVEFGVFSVTGGQAYKQPILFDLMNQSLIAYLGDNFVPLKNTDFQLENHHFKYINGAYYETFYDAKVKILVKYGLFFKGYDKVYSSKENLPPQFASNYSGEVIHKKYYFLQFSDKKLREISLNNASVTLAIMKEYEGVLYHIRKWNKKIRTEEDIVDLLEYLNGEGVL